MMEDDAPGPTPEPESPEAQPAGASAEAQSAEPQSAEPVSAEPQSAEPASAEVKAPEPKLPESKPLEPQSAEYAQIWTESFSQVIVQITGGPVPCDRRAEAPAEAAAAGAEDLWILITSAGALRGEMRLRLSPPSVLRLGQAFMSEPAAPESPLTPDHRDSVIELLRQVSGIVASAVKPRWGEVQLHVEAVTAAPSWSPAEMFWLQAGAETPPSMLLEFGLSAALVAELRAGKVEGAKASDAGKAAVESLPSSPSASGLSAGSPSSGTPPLAGALDMLMDVQLTLSMRFGSRRLQLREVLELSPGAVVELDRRIQEPVDLLLDGRLVARGEVVVIDGNYGLRVSDVSPQAV
jgi:flagellar motor switch protein FliN/FliY